MQARRKRQLGTAASYFALALIGLYSFFPVFWMINTSFRQQRDALAIPPALLAPLTLENYIYLLENTAIAQNLLNSGIIIGSTIALSLIVGVPAAYAFGRLKFRGSRDISFWILSTRMTSRIAIILPLFVMWLALGLLDTYQSIIFTYLTFNLPLVIWMMKGFFQDIPMDIEEAAMVDGCSRFGAFLRVVLPLALPGLAATAIACFIFSWNEFFFAFLLSHSRTQTAPVAILNFYNSQGILWGRMCAAATLVMAPVVVFAIIIRKYLIAGLTFGVFRPEK